MEKLEIEILTLLDKLEIDVKDAAVMDGENLEYFEDAATDFFYTCMIAIKDLILLEIPSIIEEKKLLDGYSLLVASIDIYELQEGLEEQENRFPLLKEFADSRERDDFTWQPLYLALREYFTEDRIAAISSEFEYNLAFEAFTAIKEISSDYYHPAEYVSELASMKKLQECEFADEEDIAELQEISEYFDEANFTYTPPAPQTFKGSTGGLEPRFIEWLEKHFKADTIFDDIDFDLFDDKPISDDEADFDLLLTYWLEGESIPRTSFDNYLWVPTDFRAPIDYEYEEMPIFFEIHQLSQIIRDPSNSRISHLPESMEHYKIIMYRTGERHEYNSEMDRSLLALQVLILHRSAEIPVEKIEAEVHWVRLKEFAYPLVGLGADELEQLSQVYLEAQ